jgi:ribose transport system substrate-binding protein
MKVLPRVVISSAIALVLLLPVYRASTAAPVRATQYTFGAVQILNDPFFAAVKRGAMAEARKLGNVQIIWTGPGQNNTQQQVADVQALVARRVSGIILSPGDATALVPPVQKAKAQGIPTVLYNSTLSDNSLAVATILSNNYVGAVAGGKYMCRAIGGHGQVAIIEAVTGIPVLNQRWNGFRHGLKTTCRATVVAAEITGNVVDKATSIVSSLLTRYPNLAGLYADDIVNADGVVAALQRTHKTGRVKVVAFDAEPAEVALLRQGKIKALVAQKPFLEGQDAVSDLYKYLNHQPFPKSTNVGYVLMTKANFNRTKKWAY